MVGNPEGKAERQRSTQEWSEISLDVMLCAFWKMSERVLEKLLEIETKLLSWQHRLSIKAKTAAH